MDTDTEIEFEIRMRAEVERLLEEIEAGKEDAAPPESLDGNIGRLSRQDSLMQQEMAKDAQRRRMLRLHLLQQALARMDEGTYGICPNCGGEIAADRLMETPEAPLCAACS
ncbi:MAG TPA: TraR/DksA C4-type zinc finger protein [Luteolibacter sp.]|nr:TraR/DksA C4-type zinc finger protein [Luteolibacter sp.]